MSDDPKRSPSEAWQALEKGALRDEGERVAKLGNEELDASLAARGVDPEAARRRGAELAAKLLAQRAAGAAQPATQPDGKVVPIAAARARRARPAALTWLVAAAAAAAVLGGGGAAYVALNTPEPAPTTPVPTVPSAPPGPPPEVLAKQEADTLRGRAATECGATHWAACLSSLRQAGKLDPQGAAARPVARMQAKAARALLHEELDAKGGSVEARTLPAKLAAGFTTALAEHRGQAVTLACAPGAEPQPLCGWLAAALTRAGWVVTRPRLKAPVTVDGQVVHATRVLVAPDADDATQSAADALADALEGALLRTSGPDEAPAGSGSPLTLVVGPQ
ncbi:MAG TPA: hypothetical protein VGG39_26190 [Polyangiaceae bacterium]|jgi:hypothetical protein